MLLVDLSKVESGKLDIEEVSFSLTVVVDDVCKLLSYAAARKNICFKSKIDAAIQQDLVLIGDPGRIRQILTNLLTNSIKFTFEGYVQLVIGIVEEDGDFVKVSFTIEDTGIGIEEDVQKRLFKPFTQADTSTARRYGGTGLGLTICKNVSTSFLFRIFLHYIALYAMTYFIFCLAFIELDICRMGL